MATHEELITALKFDGSFKDMVRDYYSYGFKKLEKEDKENQTLLADWKRLNNILMDYMEWSETDDKKQHMYMTQNSLTMPENPFHRVFRFCKFTHNDPQVFFNVIFALSKDVGIIEDENISQWQIFNINLESEVKNRNNYQYLLFIKENQNHGIRLEEIGPKGKYALKTESGKALNIPKKDVGFVKKIWGYWEFVNKHSDVSIEGQAAGKKEIRKIKGVCNGKWEEYAIESMDDEEIAERLIADHGKLNLYEKTYIQKDLNYLRAKVGELIDDRNANLPLTSSQLQCFYPRSTGLFSSDNNAIDSRLFPWEDMGILEQSSKRKSKEKRWKLCKITVEKIIEAGKSVNPEFENNFENALDFFSRYHVLGICGTYLLDRMRKQNISPFRFRHEYFMSVLNDFNLIDLLYAIENNKWCEIKYTYGKEKRTVLGKPLELRISSTTGREYLVFYNPVKRCCISLKLEFMEEIFYHEEVKVMEALKKRNLSQENINSDLKNAWQALKYSWGVSIAENLENNVEVPVVPKTVKLQVRYEPKTEYYIKKRLSRELRRKDIKIFEKDGVINLSAKIADRKEMHPWIRSLYSRITMVEGIEQNDFSLMNDINKINSALSELKKAEPDPDKMKQNKKDTETEVILKGGEKARIHEELFNEIFSVYYYIIADIMMHICAEHAGEKVSEIDLKRAIKESKARFSQQKGFSTDRMFTKEINWLIENNSFGKHEKENGVYYTKFKYSCEEKKDFYKAILPLTKLEIRWLKTVLQDPKMKYFLSENEINKVQNVLDREAPNTEMLHMDKIVYYDRYFIPKKIWQAEQKYINIVIAGIQNGKLLDLSYITHSGERLNGMFKPVVLEFSKRNNKFQLCAQSCANELYYYINPAQIESMNLTEECYDYFETLEKYENYRKETQCSVKVVFYNVQNIVDRILTEFSPWRKYCCYDNNTKLYTLTIFYQKDEELDLVVRLMGYGSKIHFIERDNNTIAENIQKRLEKQLELTRRQYKISKDEER